MPIADYVLVVVDMQSDFSASLNPDTRANVVREINQAMINDLPVVNLWIPYASCLSETGYHQPHAEILDLVKNYPKHFLREKLFEDGSFAVSQVCKHYCGQPAKFRVCGVNADLCVMATADGLASTFRQIPVEVVVDACSTSTPKWTWAKWRKQGHPANVALV